MMQQYWKYREEVPEDALLLFRLGDFYEMFHKDAEEGARLLGITLTKRQNYPMAGIPFHAADAYIPKLLKAGRKVAIVDQVETPKPGKLVKRALTRVLTPGTAIEEHQLDARSNHYLLALTRTAKIFHAAWLDLSTGEFQIASAAEPESLLPLFHAIDPQELLLPETESVAWAHDEALKAWHEEFDAWCGPRPITELPDFQFEAGSGVQAVMQALGVLNLDGFGIDGGHPALGPAGALVQYATETLCAPPQNLSRLSEYRPKETLLLDPATLRNLEIFRSAGGMRDGSLIEALDYTSTAAGARLLEQWLAEPRLELETVQLRQQCVGDFMGRPGPLDALRELLKRTRDLTRILGRLQNRIRNPREIGGVRDTLEQLPDTRGVLMEFDAGSIDALGQRIQTFDDLRKLLEKAVSPELPANLQDGGVIRDDFDEELDRLRALTRDNKTWISDFEQQEQQRSGIKNLKLKYNGAFGYFIEITKANLHLVPEDYVRRQTTVNAERYVTEELRAKEKEIFHAEEKALAREEALFREIVTAVLEEATALRETAAALAEVDVLAGWATLAREWNYCCPVMDGGLVLEIEEGRHPVIEQKLKADARGFAGTSSFVPNDAALSADAEQIALITGPNMAGKSTYIRQVALIALMAHVGCWVPARSCRMGLIDRIFSRVGASDELARGNSTFMVEMNETANILNNATERSLIILDEIGRGTSTYDGLSIAWAVIEHLHGEGAIGPKTLFATHYHEITRLEETLPRLRNFSVSVKEWNDDIIFVRQVVPGAADRSYGIHVARLAGMPRAVIERARTILDELEAEGDLLQRHLFQKKSGSTPDELAEPEPRVKCTPQSTSENHRDSGQLNLFS